MRLRFVTLLFAAGCVLAAGADRTMKIGELKDFVTSSVKMKLDDRKVAEILHRTKLASRLDYATVEELQGLGAGPRTVAALKELAEASTSLPAAAPAPPKAVYVPPPAPDSIAQKKVLSDVTEYAVNYTSRMPDFICAQVTRRFFDPSGMEFWKPHDVILERLSYFEKHEDYKVVLVNNKPMGDMAHEKLGGTVSSGEYASVMREIFDPYTETQFEWERWATLRGRRMHVFSYKVSQARSKYTILAEGAERLVVGYHGLIYVDRDNSTIHKITLQADDIPAGYPIREVNVSIDYEATKIAEREYVLPLKVEIKSRQGAKFLVKNDIEFRSYRKFSAESTITAFEPEPLPDSAIKEQPADKKP